MGGNFYDQEYENKPILEIKIHNRFEFKIILKAPYIIPSSIINQQLHLHNFHIKHFKNT